MLATLLIVVMFLLHIAAWSLGLMFDGRLIGAVLSSNRKSAQLTKRSRC
jgi:hypothetical protein